MDKKPLLKNDDLNITSLEDTNNNIDYNKFIINPYKINGYKIHQNKIYYILNHP